MPRARVSMNPNKLGIEYLVLLVAVFCWTMPWLSLYFDADGDDVLAILVRQESRPNGRSAGSCGMRKHPAANQPCINAGPRYIACQDSANQAVITQHRIYTADAFISSTISSYSHGYIPLPIDIAGTPQTDGVHRDSAKISPVNACYVAPAIAPLSVGVRPRQPCVRIDYGSCFGHIGGIYPDWGAYNGQLRCLC